VLLALALALVAAGASAEERARSASEVVVVKRAGVTAYEEVSEEFAERCRVRARVVSFGDEGTPPPSQIGERWRIVPSSLVVTVGQEALDAVINGGAHVQVIPTMAFHTPPGLAGPPALPTPELLLRVLQTARRGVIAVGAVYGPRSEAQMEAARAAASKMGINLVTLKVADGPAAVRGLRDLVGGRVRVNAIWLPGDSDVVTQQVFQYALRLQLERGLPLAAATRQQVHSGALMAVDFAPRAAGRAAADLANRVLEGKPLDADVVEPYVHAGARITINAQAARRLGVDTAALARMGAKLE
jgi:hypothetical protein